MVDGDLGAVDSLLKHNPEIPTTRSAEFGAVSRALVEGSGSQRVSFVICVDPEQWYVEALARVLCVLEVLTMVDAVCRDELTPIAAYIAQEMNVNAHGDVCRRIRELNGISAKACIDKYIRSTYLVRLFGAVTPDECVKQELTGKQAALLLWTAQVMQNADWDH
jgi:hypothetical protein